MEVRPWGIRVVVVQPAQTDTAMWQDADAETERTAAALRPEHRELYAKHLEGWRKRLPMNQRMARPVDTVAATIERALTASRPRARYVVGAGPRVQAAMSKLTPTPVLDAALRAGTGVPRRP
jgi:NAD(P)-dependent dehydrogenase (short-subunit alcohol dehydrogenase family)